MQSPDSAQTPTSAEQIFKNQFSDMAFNALRAKFPALINQVVTLKHMANDVEKGSAFGVFVIQSGNDLVYIPVAMADGSIVSCEMMYDKEADQFYPLDSHTVKEILAKSRSSDPVILQNNPRVEDTRRLFHSMIRPPSSSNVVLAARQEGIRGMPEKARMALADYLTNENPALLGKLASFYSPEDLAFKLSYREKSPVQEKSSDTFVRSDRLTREAVEKLTDSEKKEILKTGYIIKKADDAPVCVIPGKSLGPAIEKELGLTLYTPSRGFYRLEEGRRERVGMGRLLQVNESGISFVPVLVAGTHLYTDDGAGIYLDGSDGAFIADLRSRDFDLSTFPHLIKLSDLRRSLPKEGGWVSAAVFVPGKSGTWVKLPASLCGHSTEFSITDQRVAANCTVIELSPALTAGYVSRGRNAYIVPENSLFLVGANNCERSRLFPISSWEKLEELLKIFGTSITCSDNGAGIDLTANEKTASFPGKPDAAEWLHRKFCMDGAQIKTVFDNDRCLVFEKSAFLDPDPGMFGAADQFGPQQAQMDSPAQSSEMEEIPQNPQFDALEDFAALEDPEMFDTGILASFAQYPDAKQLLVEYMPDFLAAEDKIGRVLLLFCSQKKEIEDFYGTEKCSTLIASLRRIFSILGELVASLKLYVNMV